LWYHTIYKTFASGELVVRRVQRTVAGCCSTTIWWRGNRTKGRERGVKTVSALTQNILLYVLLAVGLANVGSLVPAALKLAERPADNAESMELKLKGIAGDLPRKGFFEYYCCDDEIRKSEPLPDHSREQPPPIEMGVLTGFRRFYTAEYVLCPRILAVYSAVRKSELCICLSSDPSKLQEFCRLSNMTAIKSYPDGVYLLRHQ
jgi:hypothetical protein